ncbi:cupin domain-containing protein [Burkholderia gladioli]|uniref:cupin domain-containing protein n=1 Tax=Burkholderia gladioli TaxID=28095 RepID=UPI00164081A3|nr:cupin domain-containing protein [Burkholderia gladioli]MBU9192183.1 cupin domain-containing protein [Burkholderia gladioli]
MKTSIRIALAASFFLASAASFAQAPGISRTEVLTQDVSVPGRHAVVSRVTVAPRGVLGWHTHDGDEISYVESGDLTLLVAGKPQQVVHAGGAFVVPAGVAHSVRDDGEAAVALITVHVVAKDKPLATPAAAPAQ